MDERILRGTALIILSEDSTGLEGEIYARLRRRKFRATTGTDDGFDTREIPYCPNCILVPVEEVDALTVASWKRVFLHEARHLIQLRRNPDLARDFRSSGRFTTYAAFCEACADDGLYTTPVYHARERMAALRVAIGEKNELLLARACQGDREAYQELVRLYEAQNEGGGAFADLFPPYY